MDYSTICLRDTVVSQRGAKSCPISNPDGSKVFLTLGTVRDPVSAPFGASSFNEAETTRLTLELNLNPEQEKAWDVFDEWPVHYLTKHSARLFKAIKTEAQIRDAHKSPVTRKEDYRPHIGQRLRPRARMLCACGTPSARGWTNSHGT